MDLVMKRLQQISRALLVRIGLYKAQLSKRSEDKEMNKKNVIIKLSINTVDLIHLV